MDSGNSGSMQSSSTAGEEEYDSRAESTFSAFLNNNNPSHPPPPSFTSQHHHMLDPLSNYLDPTQRSPSHPNPNLDMVWSKVPRSEPNQPDLGPFIPCSSSSQNHQGAFLLSQLGEAETRGVVALGAGAFPSTHQHRSLPPETSVSRGGSLSVSATSEQALTNNSNNNNNNNNLVRNPKKRSRASRRAPTTVLTTDTTNFRAMVQEFTGIPAPPFTSSSLPFPRTRLDLFAAATSSSSATIRSTSSHLDPPTTTTTPPPYLLRPFAQKPQSSPSSFPPMMDTLASNNTTHTCSNSTSVNYQNQSLNMHLHNNPIFTFQSILQAPPKYPPLSNNNNNNSIVTSKTQQPSLEIPPTSVNSHLKMGGVLEELGLRHAHVSTHLAAGAPHQNMVPSSSDVTLSNLNNHNNMRNPSLDWAQRIGNNNDGGGVLRSLGVAATLNYRNNPTASDFHGEKGPDCAVAAARSEGMVESWINCSSE